MKLQILVPQYNEDDNVVRNLLNSIEVQQSVDLKNDVGVIIAHDKVIDGDDVLLSDKLINSYSFPIKYINNDKHCGVSATRNICLDNATADYVMFCDADDMFCNVCGLYIIFREIDNAGFDSLVSNFVEETRAIINDKKDKQIVYINREMDSTFVHGKVHRRQYLIDEDIRWNDNLTIHEDSYFNIMCQRLSTNVKYCPTPFYLWKWRDNSVCRHDPKYILKTFINMLDSSDACIEQFISRHKMQHVRQLCTSIIYDCYFTMNKKEWLDQDNQKYRLKTEKRFKEYYLKYKKYFDSIDEKEKNQIIIGIKNRMFKEGLMMESITFNDWIDGIMKL